MLLLARPVESVAAEHVIGNIRELTWFFECLFFKSVCASSCTTSVKRTHIACHPNLFIPNWRDIICVSCVNRISVDHVAQNISRCIIVVQNVMSVFSCIFEWSIYLFWTKRKVLILVLFFLIC